MRLKWVLIAAALKMFFREKEAVFWTLFLPLFMIVLFGFVKFDRLGTIQLGIVDQSGGKINSILSSLSAIKTIQVHHGNQDAEWKALQKGERDVVLLIPPGYQDGQKLIAYTNDAKPQETQLGALILQRIFDEVALQRAGNSQRIQVVTQPVKSRKLTYMDFLLPGILAMSIMQMGVFSVAFVFVDLKKRGILRRLRVTPLNTNDFILAHVVTRLIVLLLQVTLLIASGVIFFHLNFIGSLWNLFVVGVLGSIVFLAIGFCIAGVSKSEDQVAPLANVITLPMMLLSGVFFSRANLPGFAHVITSVFPLTYLADGLRSIAIDGAGLREVLHPMAGLGVWCVVFCFLAVKLFRWE
ncbi:ABC transporter permease [bacterium]|nr:ABC transporter permease [bacterium]MCI0602787.1 ABC transporter permease [bacterium]